MCKDLDVGSSKLKINDSDLKILRVDKTSIFNCKVEMKDEMGTSIFRQQYKRAARSIIDIIEAPKILNEIDNIVTFIGEKGGGKTTVLRSFAQSLKDDEYSYLKDKEALEEIRFEVLNIIDLNYKMDGNSIISVVLYSIYRSLSKKSNLGNYIVKKELEEEILRLSKEVNEVFFNTKDIFDMNNNFILRESISELIRLYLNYCKKDYLVIPIDNLSGLNDISSIVCDLKKYFNCEKVIILNTLDKRVIDDGILKLEEMGIYSSAIYIEPINFSDVTLDIDEGSIKNAPKCRGKNIFEQVNNLLIEKFNYCIYTLDAFKVVVGNNVKDIVNLIIFINSLNGKLKDEEYIILKYLEETVRRVPLGGKQAVILKNILKVNISELNKYVFISLGELIVQKKRKGLIPENVEDLFSYITSNRFKIKKEKVSIGDIITCIEFFKMYKTKEVDLNFIELIKCLYTARFILQYYKDPQKTMNLLGKDYVGDYFKVIYNIEQFNNLIEVGAKRSAEDLKDFFGFRKELFISILEPCYDCNNSYLRLIYDDVTIFNKEDIYNQRYYSFKFLNILSYSLINKCKDKEDYLLLLYIINIDYWAKVLEELGLRLKSNKIAEDRYFFETIRFFREIVEESSIFSNTKELDNYDDIRAKDIEGDFIVNYEDVEFLQNLNDELIKAQYLYSYNV